jgi:biopolymer transport protein ExbD
MRGRRSRKTPELSMAPLIDMVFLLLIFFLVTTSFVRETGVQVNRPKASQSMTIKNPDLLIAVTRAGTIHVEQRQIDIGMVKPIVSQFVEQNPGAKVVVVADENSRTGLVIQVMDECKIAGASEVSIATRTQ